MRKIFWGVDWTNVCDITYDAFAITRWMAKQKFRPTRLGGFSGAKAYIRYVEVLKKHRNAKGGLFCDAITF
jgi:hypothetical protein